MATNPMLTIARRAAEEAGKILQMGLRQLDQIQIEEKGRGDLVKKSSRISCWRNSRSTISSAKSSAKPAPRRKKANSAG